MFVFFSHCRSSVVSCSYFLTTRFVLYVTLKHVSNLQKSTLSIAVSILSAPFSRNGRCTTTLLQETITSRWRQAQFCNKRQMKAPWQHVLSVSIIQTDQTDTLFPFCLIRSQMDSRKGAVGREQNPSPPPPTSPLSRSNFPRKASKIPEEECLSPHHEIQCHPFSPRREADEPKSKTYRARSGMSSVPQHLSFIDKSGAGGEWEVARGSRALNCACCDQSVFAHYSPAGRPGQRVGDTERALLLNNLLLLIVTVSLGFAL